MTRESKSNQEAEAGGASPRRRAAGVDLNELAHLAGRITAMPPLRKDPKLRALEVDGQFVLSLHAETVILAGLKVGSTIDGAALVAAARRDLERQAWDGALRMLAAHSRTCREVERGLGRSYPAEVVERVLDRLIAGSWLDDADLARRHVETHRDMGEHRLLQDLTRRGVPKPVAEAAVRAARELTDATAVARELAQRRLERMPGVDRQTAHRRLAGFLVRRGYGFDTIDIALAPLLRGLPSGSRGPRNPSPEEE